MSSAAPKGMTRATFALLAFCALTSARGETPQAENKPERGSVFFGFGAERGAVYHGASVTAHVATHLGALSGPSVMLTLSEGHEGSLVLSAGYRFGLQLGVWRFYAGPELGFGYMLYSDTGTSIIEVGPFGGIAAEVYPRAFVGLEGHFPMLLPSSRYQGIPSILFQPGGWLGFTWAF
jgi:hypothetical protein